jgi:predicted nucleic-acid-binding protein
MISPDTNVLVRILTNDDEQQAAVASEVLRSNDVYLAKTVILELEWVLRYSYEFDRDSVNGALLSLLGLDNAVVEDAETVERAIALHADGMDFAGALHLASSRIADEFVTFDRRLAATTTAHSGPPKIRLIAPDPSF